jgi:hypothetical protein
MATESKVKSLAQEKLPTLVEVWGEQALKYIMDIEEAPQVDWIVEGVVVRHGITLIYAPSGDGKTTFCLYLLHSLQTGQPFFRRKAKKVKALLSTQDQAPSLMKAQWKKLGVPKKLWIANADLKWDNDKNVFKPVFSQLLDACKLDVLIIDAYTSLGVADINHPSAGLTFDALRAFGIRHDCAFVVVHHTNLKEQQMGSNLNIAKVDSIIHLKEDKASSHKPIKRLKVIQEKLKADSCEDFELDFDTDTLEMALAGAEPSEVLERSVRQQVFEEVARGLPDEVILASHLEVRADSVKKYIRDAKKDG